MSISTPPRVAFVLASTDHGTMIVNRLDWCEKEDHLAIGVGLALLNNGSYASTETRFLCEMLTGLRETRGDGVVALDVGANIGTFTLAFAQHMEGWGEVVALEPQERVFYALAGNIALNNCFNARAILGAAGSYSGFIEVPRVDYRAPLNSGGLSLIDGPHNKPGQTVNWRNTDMVRRIVVDEMKFPRVDLMKIDVEGMEPEVLRGAQYTIAHAQPVIFAEHLICGAERIKACLPNYRFVQAGMDMLAMPEDSPLWDRIKFG